MSNLDGVNFFGDRNGLSYTVRDSVISFINHGFLELGAYINVPAASGTLTPINNVTGITQNTVFSAPYRNWVYENDFVRKDGQATNIPTMSGILINNTFVPSGAAYWVNYPAGRITLSTATTGVVKSPYATKYVGVYRKDSTEYRRLIESSINPMASGTLLEPVVQLPAVFIGVPSYETIRGTNLGNRSKYINFDVEFHIFAHDPSVCDHIQDIMYFLETKQIPLLRYASGFKPLNYRGEFTNPSGLWTYMSSNYRIGYARFAEDARVEKRLDGHAPLCYSKVTIGLEMDVIPI